MTDRLSTNPPELDLFPTRNEPTALDARILLWNLDTTAAGKIDTDITPENLTDSAPAGAEKPSQKFAKAMTVGVAQACHAEYQSKPDYSANITDWVQKTTKNLNEHSMAAAIKKMRIPEVTFASFTTAECAKMYERYFGAPTTGNTVNIVKLGDQQFCVAPNIQLFIDDAYASFKGQLDNADSITAIRYLADMFGKDNVELIMAGIRAKEIAESDIPARTEYAKKANETPPGANSRRNVFNAEEQSELDRLKKYDDDVATKYLPNIARTSVTITPRPTNIPAAGATPDAIRTTTALDTGNHPAGEKIHSDEELTLEQLFNRVTGEEDESQPYFIHEQPPEKFVKPFVGKTVENGVKPFYLLTKEIDDKIVHHENPDVLKYPSLLVGKYQRFDGAYDISSCDSLLLSLSAASAHGTDNQARLYRCLVNNVIELHGKLKVNARFADGKEQEMSLLEYWLRGQIIPQIDNHASIHVDMNSDFKKDSNDLRPENERLFAHCTQPEEELQKTIELWQQRIPELEQALAQNKLQPHHLRWIEFLSHSVDVDAMMKEIKDNAVVPTKVVVTPNPAVGTAGGTAAAVAGIEPLTSGETGKEKTVLEYYQNYYQAKENTKQAQKKVDDLHKKYEADEGDSLKAFSDPQYKALSDALTAAQEKQKLFDSTLCGIEEVIVPKSAIDMSLSKINDVSIDAHYAWLDLRCAWRDFMEVDLQSTASSDDRRVTKAALQNRLINLYKEIGKPLEKPTEGVDQMIKEAKKYFSKKITVRDDGWPEDQQQLLTTTPTSAPKTVAEAATRKATPPAPDPAPNERPTQFVGTVTVAELYGDFSQCPSAQRAELRQETGRALLMLTANVPESFINSPRGIDLVTRLNLYLRDIQNCDSQRKRTQANPNLQSLKVLEQWEEKLLQAKQDLPKAYVTLIPSEISGEAKTAEEFIIAVEDALTAKIVISADGKVEVVLSQPNPPIAVTASDAPPSSPPPPPTPPNVEVSAGLSTPESEPVKQVYELFRKRIWTAFSESKHPQHNQISIALNSIFPPKVEGVQRLIQQEELTNEKINELLKSLLTRADFVEKQENALLKVKIESTPDKNEPVHIKYIWDQNDSVKFIDSPILPYLFTPDSQCPFVIDTSEVTNTVVHFGFSEPTPFPPIIGNAISCTNVHSPWISCNKLWVENNSQIIECKNPSQQPFELISTVDAYENTTPIRRVDKAKYIGSHNCNMGEINETWGISIRNNSRIIVDHLQEDDEDEYVHLKNDSQMLLFKLPKNISKLDLKDQSMVVYPRESTNLDQLKGVLLMEFKQVQIETPIVIDDQLHHYQVVNGSTQKNLSVIPVFKYQEDGTKKKAYALVELTTTAAKGETRTPNNTYLKLIQAWTENEQPVKIEVPNDDGTAWGTIKLEPRKTPAQPAANSPAPPTSPPPTPPGDSSVATAATIKAVVAAEIKAPPKTITGIEDIKQTVAEAITTGHLIERQITTDGLANIVSASWPEIEKIIKDKIKGSVKLLFKPLVGLMRLTLDENNRLMVRISNDKEVNLDMGIVISDITQKIASLTLMMGTKLQTTSSQNNFNFVETRTSPPVIDFGPLHLDIQKYFGENIATYSLSDLLIIGIQTLQPGAEVEKAEIITNQQGDGFVVRLKAKKKTGG